MLFKYVFGLNKYYLIFGLAWLLLSIVGFIICLFMFNLTLFIISIIFFFFGSDLAICGVFSLKEVIRVNRIKKYGKKTNALFVSYEKYSVKTYLKNSKYKNNLQFKMKFRYVDNANNIIEALSNECFCQSQIDYLIHNNNFNILVYNNDYILCNNVPYDIKICSLNK